MAQLPHLPSAGDPPPSASGSCAELDAAIKRLQVQQVFWSKRVSDLTLTPLDRELAQQSIDRISSDLEGAQAAYTLQGCGENPKPPVCSVTIASPTGPIELEGAACSKWKKIAGWKTPSGEAVQDALGYPTTNSTYINSRGVGVEVQEFSHGVMINFLVSTPSVVFGAIYDRYVQEGGWLGPLGVPLVDQGGLEDGGQFTRFENGAIVDRPGTGIFVLEGPVFVRYIAGEGEGETELLLGIPTGPPTDGPRGGLVGAFDNGKIYYHPSTGGHYLQGEILARYEESGGPGGPLGYPTTDLWTTTNTLGQLAKFEGGSVWWSKDTQTRIVLGAIAKEYEIRGGAGGYLGFPTADEDAWTVPSGPQSGRISAFQYGRIGLRGDGVVLTLADTKSFSFSVETPGLVALGGVVTLDISSDGSYHLHGHMHDSGFDAYSFRLAVTLRTPDGRVTMAASKDGKVAGTLPSGNRNFDWDDVVSGVPSPGEPKYITGIRKNIRAHWPDLLSGTFTVSKSYKDDGLFGDLEDIAKDFLEFFSNELVIGPAPAAMLVFGTELLSAMHVGLLTPSDALGTAGIAGVVVFQGLTAIFGAGVGIPVAIAAINGFKHVRLSEIPKADLDEIDLVFKGTLPLERIILTNLSRPDGRKFTMPIEDGSILVNLGNDAFGGDHPMQYADSHSNYPAPGQLLIHELVHAWQIENSEFLAGFICKSIKEGLEFQFGNDVYKYDLNELATKEFKDFGVEQQAHIVDDWYGQALRGSEDDPDKYLNDPRFKFISNNIWLGEGAPFLPA